MRFLGKIFAALVIAGIAIILLSVLGFELSIVEALICGGFFVWIDSMARKAHYAYLDRTGA